MADKIIQCKTCGASMAKSAAACPSCGAKNKKKHIVRWIVLALIAIAVVGIVVSTTNRKKENSKQYKVGDTAKVNGISITLNNIDVVEKLSGKEDSVFQEKVPAEGYVFYVCDFTIKNQSDEDATISSVMCFDAYADDVTVEQEYLSDLYLDKGSLDGTLAPGKEMRGCVVFSVPNTCKKFEVHFSENLSDKRVFVFNP